jgi:hypothetical protein
MTYDGSPNKKEGTRWSTRTFNVPDLSVPALQGLGRVGANSFSLLGRKKSERIQHGNSSKVENVSQSVTQ